MSNTNFKTAMKRTLVGACVAIACATSSAPAAAYVEVDPEFRIWERAIYSVFVQEVTNQFFAINTYLAQIYAYLRDGEGDSGKGVIGTMNKIWTEQRPYMEGMSNQQSAWGRRNTMDGVIAQTIANKLPDPRNCSELPTKAGARAAGGGGGGGARAKGGTEAAVASTSAGTGVDELTEASNVLASHDAKKCSYEDVTNTGAAAKRFGADRRNFGCTAPGPMPDGDARIQSIFTPAHDYVKVSNGDAAEIGRASSLTFDANGGSKDQALSADQSIKNLLNSFSPPALPHDAERSPAGQLLSAKIKLFNGRVSPAVAALSSIKASRDSMALNSAATGVEGSVQKNWLDLASKVYPRILPPQTPVPKNPSQAEILRFEVYRRFWDFGADSWLDKIQNHTGDALQADIAETLALNGYIQYLQLQRTEEQNALLSSILAQSINPMSKQEVETSAQKAMRNK